MNGNKVIEYCKEEDLDSVFYEITRYGDFEIFIIRDDNALEWNYEYSFSEYNIIINKNDEYDRNHLCSTMEKVFDRNFELDNSYNMSNEKIIKVLCHGNCCNGRNNYEYGETLKQAEEILKNGGEGMTELAKIIREKYERMNKNE